MVVTTKWFQFLTQHFQHIIIVPSSNSQRTRPAQDNTQEPLSYNNPPSDKHDQLERLLHCATQDTGKPQSYRDPRKTGLCCCRAPGLENSPQAQPHHSRLSERLSSHPTGERPLWGLRHSRQPLLPQTAVTSPAVQPGSLSPRAPDRTDGIQRAARPADPVTRARGCGSSPLCQQGRRLPYSYQ